ncbi:MAG: glycosyltransferase family 8 protein [bacterium]|nr:glycosyltransferase family 8 protein [bacterium]
MKKEVIPIMFCFDTNYVIPASTAFYSLMEHANKKYYYKFYILHSDITKKQQEKLKLTLIDFKDNVDLTFINMNDRFNDIWNKLKSKVHFSKEVLYKLLVSSLFPNYDKLIVSDVDVLFLDDISKSYFSINSKDKYYLSGVRQIGFLKNFNSVYANNFTADEISLLNGFCGGYIVFNLRYMREKNIEEKFIQYLSTNYDKIIYAEQDVLNICCDGKVKYLSLNYCTCTYMWDFYKTDHDFSTDSVYSKNELKSAMKNPIQLHYASTEKPWKYVDTIKSEEWFKYIVKTPFLREYLEYLPSNIVIKKNELPKKKNTLKNIFLYIKRNPLFLFKKDFYKKVISKLVNK